MQVQLRIGGLPIFQSPGFNGTYSAMVTEVFADDSGRREIESLGHFADNRSFR
jgi:hypothetical protein